MKPSLPAVVVAVLVILTLVGTLVMLGLVKLAEAVFT